MSYDHWRTGGDSPGITEDQQLEELRERYEEAARDAEPPPSPIVCTTPTRSGTCGHHRFYHTSWGDCLVEGCGCKEYYDAT